MKSLALENAIVVTNVLIDTTFYASFFILVFLCSLRKYAVYTHLRLLHPLAVFIELKCALMADIFHSLNIKPTLTNHSVRYSMSIFQKKKKYYRHLPILWVII